MNLQKIKQLEDLKRDYATAFNKYANKEGASRKGQLQGAASAFVAFFKKESFSVRTFQNDCFATYSTFSVKLSLANNPTDSRPISIELEHDYSPISLYQIDLDSSINTVDYYPPDTDDMDEKIASEIEMLTKNIATIKEWENANHLPNPFFVIVAARDKDKNLTDVPEELKEQTFSDFNELLNALFLNNNAFQP